MNLLYGRADPDTPESCPYPTLPAVVAESCYGSPYLRPLLSGLLAFDPCDRPTAKGALEHPVFYFGVASSLFSFYPPSHPLN